MSLFTKYLPQIKQLQIIHSCYNLAINENWLMLIISIYIFIITTLIADSIREKHNPISATKKYSNCITLMPFSFSHFTSYVSNLNCFLAQHKYVVIGEVI